MKYIDHGLWLDLQGQMRSRDVFHLRLRANLHHRLPRPPSEKTILFGKDRDNSVLALMRFLP